MTQFKLHNVTVKIDGSDFTLTGTTVADADPPIDPPVDPPIDPPVDPPIDPPTQPDPPAGAKRWHPGHYLKTQGNHADSDQDKYWDKVNSSIDQRVEDIEEILGAYVTVAWRTMNPTGSTFDFTRIDTVFNNLKARGRRMILELSYKSFSTKGKGLEAPADLQNEIDATMTGWFTGVHRPHVMDRYILAMKAIAERYDGDPMFEMITNAETAPSFGSNEPNDYSKGKLAGQLKQLYGACASVFTNANYCPLINHLGKEVPDLVEELYKLRVGLGGPDARQDSGWDVFKGEADAVRDYRMLISRYLTVSNSSLDKEPPTVVINQSQANFVTHLSWIPAHKTHSWGSIKTAIQANPDLYTDCPERYPSCSS